MQFSSIWPIDRTLSGTTTSGQCGPGNDGNEGVLRIPQSFSITGTSPSDCLMSYLGHSLGEGSIPSAEVQSVYSTALADWSKCVYKYEWCNCDRRWKWTRRHVFKSWTRLIAFHIALIPLGKVWIQLFSLQLWVNSRVDWVISVGEATSLGEGKLWIQTY